MSVLFFAVVPCVAAADDEVRFTSKNFLDKFDAFIAQNEKTADKPGVADGTEINLDVSFNGLDRGEEPGFVYFKRPEAKLLPVSQPSLDVDEFTPRLPEQRGGLNLGTVPGESWLLYSFTPRIANAHLLLGANGSTGEGGGQSTFGVALSSSIQPVAADLPGVAFNPGLANAFNRRAYDFGLKVGYSNFNVGASLKREYGGLADGYEGYDIGLSYNRPSWSTSLSVGEYRNNLINLYDSNSFLNDDFYALDFGASLRVVPGMRLTGGVRWLEYGRDYSGDFRLGTGLRLPPRSQLFYLGTRVNF